MGNAESDNQSLSYILAMGGKRAWARDFFAGAARSAFWCSCPISIVMFYLGNIEAIGGLIGVYGFLVVLGGTIGLGVGYPWRKDYTRHLDEYMDANGRIVNAAEFASANTSDPLIRLAIQEAESLIAQANKPYVQKAWSWDARLFPLGIVCVGAMAILLFLRIG